MEFQKFKVPIWNLKIKSKKDGKNYFKNSNIHIIF